MLGIEIDDLGMAAIFMALILLFISIAVWFFVSKKCETCGNKHTINSHNGHPECWSCEIKRIKRDGSNINVNINLRK